MRALTFATHLYLVSIKLLVLAAFIPMYLVIALIEAVCYDMGG